MWGVEWRATVVAGAHRRQSSASVDWPAVLLPTSEGTRRPAAGHVTPTSAVPVRGAQTQARLVRRTQCSSAGFCRWYRKPLPTPDPSGAFLRTPLDGGTADLPSGSVARPATRCGRSKARHASAAPRMSLFCPWTAFPRNTPLRQSAWKAGEAGQSCGSWPRRV